MIAAAQPQLETPRLKLSRRTRQFRHVPHRAREGVIFVVQGIERVGEALHVAGANRVHEIARELALLGDDTERIVKLGHAPDDPAPDVPAARIIDRHRDDDHAHHATGARWGRLAGRTARRQRQATEHRVTPRQRTGGHARSMKSGLKISPGH